MTRKGEAFQEALATLPAWLAFLDEKEAAARARLEAARAAATPAEEAAPRGASMAALLDEVLADEAEEGEVPAPPAEAEAKEVPAPPAEAEASTPLVAGEEAEEESEVEEGEGEAETSEGDEMALPPGEDETGNAEHKAASPEQYDASEFG